MHDLTRLKETSRVENHTTQSSTALEIPFFGFSLRLIPQPATGHFYVVMHEVIRDIGLAWPPQHRKLTTSAAYEKYLAYIPISAGAQEQKVLCLDLRRFEHWLESISVRRVRDPARLERLRLYQTHAYRMIETKLCAHSQPDASHPHEIPALRAELAQLRLMREELIQLRRFSRRHLPAPKQKQLPAASPSRKNREEELAKLADARHRAWLSRRAAERDRTQALWEEELKQSLTEYQFRP